MDITTTLSRELGAQSGQVQAAVALLDGGASVPFIARYRKEATGGLDDSRLRLLAERLGYLRDLEQRRQVVLQSIGEQGKLTPGLEQAIQEAETKTALEDLYLPFRPKRHTKAQKAREAGLEPLAAALLKDPALDPWCLAQGFCNPGLGVPDAQAALEGAQQILVERFAEDAALLARLRETVWSGGALQAQVAKGKEAEGAKFKDYFAYHEPVRAIPSHRALALFRGEAEGVLGLKLRLEPAPGGSDPCEALIARQFGIAPRGRAADAWLLETVRAAWSERLRGRVESDLRARLREAAEAEAIQVFARNLKDLLLAAPAGPRTTLGLDPGLRTGVKAVVVDPTGKLLESATVYPHPPRNDWAGAKQRLAELAARHRVQLVSIGNGTASRETDRLVAELLRERKDLGLTRLVVSEAGASVYSASELAAREFPALDVSLRGAVSIARRLQDPLAELVKIEPRSIGVGQYQHDVDQPALARSLEAVVEDCVNAVGVNVNTASEPLLARVSGLNQGLARNIVAYRDQHGAFRNRMKLKEVPRLGARAFEQAAGFLRIPEGDDPLDSSAVHPEAYPVVRRILRHTGRTLQTLIGDRAFLKSLDPRAFVDERFGIPTVSDILAELEKPGRDPRPAFQAPVFAEGVEALGDLRPGMRLEGTVTNVTNFGAFVDVGVHQDGLVHISQLADRFVKDPREVVRAGEIVQVRVVSVDLERRRIALTMKRETGPAGATDPARPAGPAGSASSPGSAGLTGAPGAAGGTAPSPGVAGERRGPPGSDKRERLTGTAPKTSGAPGAAPRSAFGEALERALGRGSGGGKRPESEGGKGRAGGR